MCRIMSSHCGIMLRNDTTQERFSSPFSTKETVLLQIAQCVEGILKAGKWHNIFCSHQGERRMNCVRVFVLCDIGLV